MVLSARFLGIFRLKVRGKSLYQSIDFFDKQFCIIFILALRVANLSSSKAGRFVFKSFIKYVITRYFMRYSTGKILCLILRPVVLSNLVLLKHAFYPQFSCLFRVTRRDFLGTENRTMG